MKMRKLIITILFVAIFSPLVSSQTPNPENLSWSLGWDDDEEPAIMELDSSNNFEIVLKFWIENSRPVPSDFEIDVQIEYPEFDCNENEFSIDSPSKVSVDASTNETFEYTISGNGYGNYDGWLCPASNIFSTELSVSDLVMAGQAGDGSKQIERDLKYSEVYDLQLDFSTNYQQLTVKSGTNEFISLEIYNAGNSPDAISSFSAHFEGCPQMDYAVESEDDFKSTLETHGSTIGKVELIASPSHPDKMCEFYVKVVSEGNGRSYLGGTEFKVEAPDIKEEEDGAEEAEENGGSESLELGAESSSMPAISSLLCVITVIFSAFIRRKTQ